MNGPSSRLTQDRIMTLKTLGIIGAMAEEVAILAERLEDSTTSTHAGSTFHVGQLHGMKIVLLQSGIGKVNAAVGACQMIERYQPDAIINTGSAGGFASDLEIGDVVISSEVRHHDVDAVVFGYEHGQVPQMPAAYPSAPELVKVARECVEAQGEIKAREGLICTGDIFMSDPELVALTRSRFPNMLAAEMEAAAIAQTCYLYDMPFVVIRALSDIAGKDNNSQSFEEFLHVAARQSSRMVDAMVKRLAS